MSYLTRIKRRIYLFLVNHIYAGAKKFERKRRLLNKAGFSIGENTKIVGPIDCTAKLTIGKNCWIGKNLQVNGNGEVVIGDHCDIAPDVAFQTGGHEIGNRLRRAGAGKNYRITVGDGTWIGARASILGGVHVGEGCVVAACVCVCKDVDRDCLVGGVPAQTIRKL